MSVLSLALRLTTAALFRFTFGKDAFGISMRNYNFNISVFSFVPFPKKTFKPFKPLHPFILLKIERLCLKIWGLPLLWSQKLKLWGGQENHLSQVNLKILRERKKNSKIIRSRGLRSIHSRLTVTLHCKSYLIHLNYSCAIILTLAIWIVLTVSAHLQWG